MMARVLGAALCILFSSSSILGLLQVNRGETFDAKTSESGSRGDIRRKQDRLIRAIYLHDTKAVKALLAEGLDPNYMSNRSLGTPLSEAIAERQSEIVTVLLNHRADVNFGTEQGVSPLTVAAWYDDVKAVRELIRRGARVEVRDDEGYTPLLLAASHARGTATARLLIAAGADPGAKSTDDGDNAIMLAAQNLNIEAVRLFISLGLDPCAQNKEGNTAVYHANFRIVKGEAEMSSRRAILALLAEKCR